MQHFNNTEGGIGLDQCYCQLVAEEQGFWAAVNAQFTDYSQSSTSTTRLCFSYYKDQLWRNGLMVVASLGVVMVNTILKETLYRLSYFEMHESATWQVNT